jgi:hypothetical protein
MNKGSALSLGDTVAPLFKQLGIYDDFVNASLVNDQVYMRDEQGKLDFVVDFSPSVMATKNEFDQQILLFPCQFKQNKMLTSFFSFPKGRRGRTGSLSSSRL